MPHISMAKAKLSKLLPLKDTRDSFNSEVLAPHPVIRISATGQMFGDDNGQVVLNIVSARY